MLIHIKMTRLVFETVRADLNRPHSFAYERVGFIFARKGAADSNTILLLATDYNPVPDAQYINDPKVGAKINSTAIRNVMERAYSSKESILHVHQHEGYGSPRFSKVDRIAYSKMIPSFHNIGGGAIHGALIFSFDNAAGLIWKSKTDSPEPVRKLTIVGYPIETQRPEARLYV